MSNERLEIDERLKVGCYVRWLRPIALHDEDRDYIYGLVTEFGNVDIDQTEPEIRILDIKTQKQMWLPLRLLIEFGSLQYAHDGDWILLNS